MLRIFELCPNLVEINGSVVVHDPQRKMIIPNLRKANLEFIKADTISWLLMNAPNLECLQVILVLYRLLQTLNYKSEVFLIQSCVQLF